MGLNTEQLAAVNSTSDRILCLAGAGAGKALRNGTKVKTVQGDIPIEKLSAGDLVFGLDGNPYPVVGVYPQGVKPVFRITFSDDNFIDCSEDHLWIYQTQRMRDKGRDTELDVASTKQLMDIPLRITNTRPNYNNLWIPMCKPCQYEPKEIPLDPYLLGLLIGDGTLSTDSLCFSNSEQDLISYVSEEFSKYGCELVYKNGVDYRIRSNYKRNVVKKYLSDLGLLCKSIDKHVPDIYKYNSVEIRFALLQGLIDTDGYVDGSSYQFYTSSKMLADDVSSIVESLGMSAKIRAYRSYYLDGDKNRIDMDHYSYTVYIKPNRLFMNLHRSAKHTAKRERSTNQNFARRHVVSICKLNESDDMTCISVNSPDHSFLTEHYIPTHNTTTFISRISKLVDDGVMPSSILALTFTNAAAAEMRERYEIKHVGQMTPQFRTFHSFCYSIVCRDYSIRSALGYDVVPNIASEAEEKDIKERARAQCKISLTSDQLNHREWLSKKELFQAELYDKAVWRLMKQENLITFDKLNSEVADLFAADHIATKQYKQQYKYIFVDEFQDTDGYQIKFLNSFTDTNFYFCGDCLQNLYSFRGTSNEYIKALAESEGWEKIKLYTNYRSTNQIVEYANNFSKGYAKDAYRVEMKGTRGGEKVVTKIVDGPVKFEAINTASLDDVLKELSNLTGTTAILVRSNKELNEVNSYLKDKGIEFTSSRDTKTMHLLECAVSDEYMVGWLASYLTSDKYGEYIRLSAQKTVADANWFLKTYGNNAKIAKDAAKISKLRTIATENEPVAKKIKKVEDALKLKGIDVPDRDLFGLEFLKYVKEHAEVIKSSELYVGTIHSVKGLEYDNVFVMNVNSYSFKINSSEEMSNLYYVACTRAKNRLFIYKIASWYE